ncbi:hypothetical protein BH11BAC3_BH11BAC3_39610 [soil metagenome]
MEFFNGMNPLLQTFWFIALPATLIFLVQTVLTFTGGDATDGLHADFDSDLTHSSGPFQLFSLRNLVNFLLGFGWSGISFFNSIESKGLLIFISTLIGVAFVASFFFILLQVKKLGEDNSFNINNAVGKTGSVYLTIPALKSGIGKVQVSVKGAVHELEAITLGEKILTGALIKIVKIENEHLLIVETI